MNGQMTWCAETYTCSVHVAQLSHCLVAMAAGSSSLIHQQDFVIFIDLDLCSLLRVDVYCCVNLPLFYCTAVTKSWK